MRLPPIIFLCLLNMSINAQEEKFNNLSDSLMFNIYSGAPDSIILPFLKNHFPYLTKHPEPGGWTMYPPEPRPNPQPGMHSLLVEKHPFIKSKHTGARLDLLTQEWPEGASGIQHIRIWIYFDDKRFADSTCNQIVIKFRRIGAYIEYSIDNKIEKINIKKNASDEEYQSVVIKKMSSENKHSILILFNDDTGESW